MNTISYASSSDLQNFKQLSIKEFKNFWRILAGTLHPYSAGIIGLGFLAYIKETYINILIKNRNSTKNLKEHKNNKLDSSLLHS